MRTPRLVRGPSPEEKHPARSRWTPWLMVLAALVVAVAYQAGRDVASGASSAARVGSQAPDFTLRLLNGQGLTLSSLKGKPILVNFWHSG